MPRREIVSLWLAVMGVQAYAAVPLQINHQGLVTVSGALFNGNGDFRFALVDPDVGVNGTNRWTNDGTNIGTDLMPTAAINRLVTNGIYSVRLGDASITNMTVVPSSVFNDDNVVLRIWFDDTTGGGVQQLSPDHVLTSASYAYRALNADAADFASTAGDADTVDGLHGAALEESAEIDADIAAHASGSSAHHARYTDPEAVTAVTTGPVDLAVGTTIGGQPIATGGGGGVPIGTVQAWLKSFSNVPALSPDWVECNGQVLADPGSLFDGLTIPNLNGSPQRFLRGSSSSGTVGGAQSHTHSYWTNARGTGGSYVDVLTNILAQTHLPPYYEVVWILKVK